MPIWYIWTGQGHTLCAELGQSSENRVPILLVVRHFMSCWDEGQRQNKERAWAFGGCETIPIFADCLGTWMWSIFLWPCLVCRNGCYYLPIVNIYWIMEKAREFQKNIYFCFIDYAKAFDCVDHNKLWEILKEMGLPDHLICLLRSLYAGQEATVRTGHGTTDWFQIGKGVQQGCILSPCLFNLYTEYIMRNTGLEETQAGIKIAGRNINNLRYADDTTLMAESEERKSLLMKVKEKSEKVGIKLNI